MRLMQYIKAIQIAMIRGIMVNSNIGKSAQYMNSIIVESRATVTLQGRVTVTRAELQ